MISMFSSIYVNAWGSFLPGEPVGNDHIDRFIAPLNGASRRVKSRVLKDNGIRTRHYAVDEKGAPFHSVASMAAEATRRCLAGSLARLEDISFLGAATSGPDVLVPGFANMLQGELGAPPLETASHQGVCAAGVSAFLNAARAVQSGTHQRALVAASEFPSRLFKTTRFSPQGYDVDFDAHFLRWMLSDGAGAWLLGSKAEGGRVSLRLKWVHLKSFSGDFPVCMQVGSPRAAGGRSWLEYDTLAEAEKDGAVLLRQDIRLLPHLFEVGIHEYVDLARKGLVDPSRIDHFLCHYSSEKFAPVVKGLLEKAGLDIPSSKWFSNLAVRGNTGSASIFIMLDDFMRQRRPKPGETILCFIPESGRFTVSFLLFEVVASEKDAQVAELPPPPAAPADGSTALVKRTLADLTSVWHDYRSRAWRAPFARKIQDGVFTQEDYLRWTSCWIPQVREGSLWMRRAAENLTDRFSGLRSLIEAHAGDEQNDYQILYEDYRRAGGTMALDDLRRNRGGEALNAFMFHRASQPDAADLLGAVYIIEGTGSRIIPALLPALKKQLRLPENAFRFLAYHGGNDPVHLARWLKAVELVLAADPSMAEGILDTARVTADLYLLQWERV